MEGCEWRVLVIGGFSSPATRPRQILAACLGQMQLFGAGHSPQLCLCRGPNFLAELRLNVLPFLQRALLRSRAASEYMFFQQHGGSILLQDFCMLWIC